MKTPMMTTKELSEAGVTRIVMPETKSETPRTDRAVKDCYLGEGELNPLIDFCRELERELNSRQINGYMTTMRAEVEAASSITNRVSLICKAPISGIKLNSEVLLSFDTTSL